MKDGSDMTAAFYAAWWGCPKKVAARTLERISESSYMREITESGGLLYIIAGRPFKSLDDASRVLGVSRDTVGLWFSRGRFRRADCEKRLIV